MMAARGLAWLACLFGVANPVGLHFVPKPSAGMPTYFFILGMEGTGHHFWSALGGALAALEPLGASEAGARALDGLQHRVKLCFLQLSRPKAPGACDGAGCAAGASCRLNATAETRRAWVRSGALHAAGCSYPCGARDPREDAYGTLFTSPDFPRLARELAASDVRARAVVMARDPLAAVTSSHFRRHVREHDFATSTHALYAALGLLDGQVRAAKRARVPVAVVAYEDLVARTTATAYYWATERVGHLLNYDPELVRKALGAPNATDARAQGRHGSPEECRFVDYLFLLSTPRDWYPFLWPWYERYVPDAAAADAAYAAAPNATEAPYRSCPALSPSQEARREAALANGLAKRQVEDKRDRAAARREKPPAPPPRRGRGSMMDGSQVSPRRHRHRSPLRVVTGL